MLLSVLDCMKIFMKNNKEFKFCNKLTQCNISNVTVCLYRKLQQHKTKYS